jgi:hypothetical protein
MLENLSMSNKLDLISRLTLSAKTGKTDSDKLFSNAFGAWDKNEAAEKLIDEIHKSRTFNRQIEEF